jgi:hypothetical protein
MAITDASGVSVAACLAGTSPYEVKLIEPRPSSRFVEKMPKKRIDERPYDMDILDEEFFHKQNVEIISLHRPPKLFSVQVTTSLIQGVRDEKTIEGNQSSYSGFYSENSKGVVCNEERKAKKKGSEPSRISANTRWPLLHYQEAQ